MLLGAVDWLHYLFMVPLALVSIFMILVVLVQRGRGGGLTGALGGMGGQSAFGTKAGDLFTKITIGVALVWVVLAMSALSVLNNRGKFAGLNPTNTGVPSVTPGDDDEASKTGAESGDKSGKTPVGKADKSGGGAGKASQSTPDSKSSSAPPAGSPTAAEPTSVAEPPPAAPPPAAGDAKPKAP